MQTAVFLSFPFEKGNAYISILVYGLIEIEEGFSGLRNPVGASGDTLWFY